MPRFRDVGRWVLISLTLLSGTCNQRSCDAVVDRDAVDLTVGQRPHGQATDKDGNLVLFVGDVFTLHAKPHNGSAPGVALSVTSSNPTLLESRATLDSNVVAVIAKTPGQVTINVAADGASKTYDVQIIALDSATEGVEPK